MKYGILFLILGMLLGWSAIQDGGWLLMLWPAANCLIIGIAYVGRLPQLFGKRANGSMSPLTTFLLLPYLSYLWFLWHILRRVQTENAFDHLNDQLVIGRRLLFREMPSEIQNVIDLTCEFREPPQIPANFNYISFPILDASVARFSDLQSLIEKIDSLEGKSYIHCAQGHGRTGWVTAAILLSRHPEMSVEDAISQIRATRPALRCNREQMRSLNEMRRALKR